LVAHALIAVPPLQGHLTDLTKTLSAEQAQAIEQSLTTFENRNGTQIAILILPSTGPEPIEPFSIRVAEKWKIGRKRKDDGVILVIAKADRAVRIEVGYGLEGVLTDLHSQRIINDIILPHFKRDDFYGGIKAGVADIIRRIDKAPVAEALPPGEPFSKPVANVAPAFTPDLTLTVIAALLIGGVLRLIFGRIPGALLTGVLVTLVTWFVIGALFLAIAAGAVALALTLWGGGLLGIAARLIGGGRGGRGGGGGFGGGGFRGGGGGFGGGGGSGRW
jgi:uncharacterized protein